MDIGRALVEEILLSSGEDINFHVFNKAEARQSGPPPLSPLLRPASPVVKGECRARWTLLFPLPLGPYTIRRG
jgi:hypothetical protein